MSKRLFTSDWHLGHNAILKYRPSFSSIEEHDQNIIDQLSVLSKRDLVFVLGDILFDGDKYDYYIDILNKMSCRFKFVLGNHDSRKLYSETRLTNMELCLPLFSYKNLWISHAPLHPSEIRGRDLNIHGHCHNHNVKRDSGLFDDERYFNVILDQNYNKFVSFEEIESRVKENRKGA